MDARDRGRLMNKLADLIEKNIDELAELETLDNGKPIGESRNGDLPLVIDCFRYYAGWADKIHGQTIPIRGNYFCYTKREPVGVAGQIIPWNFPMLMVAWKWGPALAAGCTVVLKPAEQTPLTALRIGELALEAGYPAGVINIVPGFGETAGDALVKHPGVDKIAFTGEATHRPDHHEERRRHAQADHLRARRQEPEHRLRRRRPRRGRRRRDARPVPQPGPVLLRRQPAVRPGHGLRRVRREAGRARSRPASSATRSTRRPSRGRRSTRPSSTRSCGYIDKGKAQGPGASPAASGSATRATSSSRRSSPTSRTTWRSPATRSSARCCRCSSSTTIDEVIERANTTDYGLAAAVWTRDIGKAHAIADRVRAGTVWVNCYDVFDAAAPFGGFKRSGIGRELGEKALDNYTELKTVTVALD